MFRRQIEKVTAERDVARECRDKQREQFREEGRQEVLSRLSEEERERILRELQNGHKGEE